MDLQISRGKLMLASFLTLVASGVGFATRTAAGTDWETEFGIGGGEFGAILGAGFLGFGIMIFFGGILVEAFGYKKLLVLAFLMHLVSAAMLFAANPLFESWQESDPENATSRVFGLLFWSAFLFSICQGLYEAVINPLIAQIYPENKTHYLNILHAGWPAGMIIGGLFAAGFIGPNAWFVQIPWQWGLSSFAIIVVAYGILALPERFPETVGESSTAGFATVFSCFLSIPFLVLIVLHALIGYMELGVDSWMTKLMENVLPNAVLILVYTSALMFVLRFFAGPIVHRINPIGLLLGSSIIACLGLLWLGMPTENVMMVFAAATFYSFGKAFLWPTMLGVAGERYPQSGAIAMGALGAAGMLTVGQIAGPRIGAQQGYHMSQDLQEAAPETFDRYKSDELASSWGYEYTPIAPAKLGAVNQIKEVDGEGFSNLESIREADLLSAEDKETMLAHAEQDIPAVQAAYVSGGRQALTLTAMVPFAMAIGFAGLLVYFFTQGGYKPVEVHKETEEEEEVALGMGDPAPAEY
ncbi:MFS transporter [Roseimaritima ulvae]|uniref:Major Facilitator Superfamily protein n=1 Tax=Roseimaritima ulvae TaxID=980254 RepID=A0A5B9QXJ7_9BACT|nr:MFS transporter [Roseimaritima ulvae]QEG42095.1 Major Facilitator Superfamily protein [Roseimaritima ulvae]